MIDLIDKVLKYILRPWDNVDPSKENYLSWKVRIIPPFVMEVCGYLAALSILYIVFGEIGAAMGLWSFGFH